MTTKRENDSHVKNTQTANSKKNRKTKNDKNAQNGKPYKALKF